MSYNNFRIRYRQPMSRLDLVLLKQGRPVAVVEAKARPIPAAFEKATRQQLLRYATATNSHWAILVDPEEARIFCTYETSMPYATLPTREILGIANIRSGVVGERVLLEAVNRWLASPSDILIRHPQLRDFVKAVSDGVTSTENWPLHA